MNRVSSGRMKSESEMPLQVAPTSATPLLLPSMINSDIDIASQNFSTAALHHHSSPRAAVPAAPVGGDRRIVLNAVHTTTQNSALKLLKRVVPIPVVLDSTGKTESPIESHAEIFSEHRKTQIFTDTTRTAAATKGNEIQTQQHYYSLSRLSHQIQTIGDPQQNDKPIQHPISCSDNASSSGSLNFATKTHHNTPVQPHEQRNREHHLGFPTIESTDNTTIHTNININQQRPSKPHYLQQQHQHQHHSLATLPQHPQPPVQYTGTAAEIAHPSYSQNHKMGNNSRGHSISPYGELYTDTKRDVIPSRKETADEDASRTSISTDSSGRMSPIHDTPSNQIIVGTPSTVSTAPSSDDEPILDYKLDETTTTTTLPNLLHPLNRRRRSFGEEDLLYFNDPRPLHHSSTHSTQELNPWMPQALPTNPRHTPQRSWDGVTSLIPNHHQSNQQQHQRQHQPPQPQPQQRVASFRNDTQLPKQLKQNEKTLQAHPQRLIYHSPPKEYYSQQRQQQQHFPFQQQQHFPFQQQQQQHIPFQQQQPQSQIPLSAGHRKISYSQNSNPKTASPPRSGRNQRQQGNRQTPLGGQLSSPHQSGSSSQRSSSEVLKTLLRKKACLYEPDTSRSVALVTWLVGRVLALDLGFFSRQQLQSGVHACVSSKIEAGTITRTKVNRCMQIILNSCFHYIIPRSDGSEEKGDYFRKSFSETVQDDSLLLKELPKPWNDLVVDRDTVIHAILHEAEEKTPHQTSTNYRSPSSSPRHSPKLGGINAEKNSDKYNMDGEKEEASKRAVLLCFNENVRSAEDVFRCHNEFIRDTANASNLQLTAQEWGQFFGHEVSRDPHLLGNIGVTNQIGASLGRPPIQPDLLGRMSTDESGKFRSTWCTKRYEHDHNLCGFAHIEVNGGWLRRNPLVHSYKNEMCKFVTHVGNDKVPPGTPANFFLNECPNGLACGYAHSTEEINYHPNTYKKRVCTSLYSRSGGCRLGDVCPNVHPTDSNRPFKKSLPESRSPEKRGKKNFVFNAKSCYDTPPSGSPIVYASPAPVSRFEHQLGMPGLQNLYRRQSEVVRAYARSSGNVQCSYSLFGDQVTIFTPDSTLE